MLRILAPTKQKYFTKRIFGFDIETYDNNKKFLMASIVGNDYKKVFYTKEEFITEIKTNYIFRNSCLFATNLSFDFFGIFFNSENFQTLFRGSNLLMAKTWFYNGEFYPCAKINTMGLKSITFLDSMNYASLSVEKMGEIIGIHKYKKPLFLGKKPKNKKEWNEIEEYNKQDSYITFKFMEFMINSVEELGATFKMTLASTSMSLFKNKYLKQKFYGQSKENLLFQFESYYGGRTEAFKRGLFKNYFYYDFSSLYPSVMRENVYPNPNTLRRSRANSCELINNYEGCSRVDIYIPNMKYPPLPVRRKDGKVLFPYGNITGVYTHIELRYAESIGCKINKVYETHYYEETLRPFESFVNELYFLRLKYKREKNKMEYVIKILMNSLYGKFGQKFQNKDNWTHVSSFEISKHKDKVHIEEVGEYIRTEEDTEPSAFCIPIWASYVSSYGRIKLHKEIIKHNPIYVDTDSIMIDHEIPQSDELGMLKLEMKIKKGIIIRPKFYTIVSDDEKEHVKIKGLPLKLTYDNFIGLTKNKKVCYTKFMRFKEAVRRDFIPNEIVETSKEFNMEDTKRRWGDKLNIDILQDSEALCIDEV